MNRGVLAILAAVLAALAGLWPVTASGRPVEAARTCHAGAAIGEHWRTVAADPARWRCDGLGQSLDPDVTLIRYDLKLGHEVPHPRSFVTHYGKFEQVTLIALDRDGPARLRIYPMDTIHRVDAGPFISAELPEVTHDTVAVFAVIERPWLDMTLIEHHLDSEPLGSGWPIGEVSILAMICGILLVPLLLNAAFYWALPERYVLWHLLMVSSTLIQAAIMTGLITQFVAIPPSVEVAISDLSFATLLAGGLMFMRAFVEPGTLSKGLSRAMVVQATLAIVVVAVVTLLLPSARPIGILLVHLAMLPGVVLLLAAMVDARLRGSQAVLFQIVGLTPVLLVGIWRICSFVFGTAPSEAPIAYHGALAFEVLVTAVAIISRFAILRRERDQARDRFEQLEGEAGHDPLTGLLNRRGIEARYDELRRNGFDTLAVVDLDHFKSVNDARGHAVGDSVLAATGLALRDDSDLIAWRLGGEEFLLMLRGRNAVARAEARRRAIPTRVAALVPGLPGPVTASMGVVELPRGAMLATSYGELYARADRLLYEAKHGGRNRMVAEKLTVFVGKDRRRRVA